MEPWQRFYDAVASRLARIPADAFDRAGLVAEAAHDAYQQTTDELTRAGWDEERALMLGRVFSNTVKQWLDRAEVDPAVLEEELRSQYFQWESGE